MGIHDFYSQRERLSPSVICGVAVARSTWPTIVRPSSFFCAGSEAGFTLLDLALARGRLESLEISPAGAVYAVVRCTDCLLAAAIFVTGASATASAESKLVTVVGASASTRQRPGEQWSPIRAGDAPGTPADLRAGDASVTLALSNGARLVLAPHAEVRLLGALDVSPKAGVKTRATSIRLDAGSLSFAVPLSAASSSVLVSHGDSAFTLAFAGSEGELRLVGDPLAVLYAAAVKGRIQVASKGAFTDLGAGQVTAVSPGASILSLPSSPSLNEKDALALVTDLGSSSPVPIGWAATTGAQDYVVEVARDADFADLVSTEHVTEPHADLPQLSPGAYHARVTAVGIAGFVGAPSASIPLRVLEATLPSGTRVDAKGQWLLPPGSAIGLPHPDGLELAIDRGGFFRAPKTFRLPSDELHTVRLRLAHGSSQVSLAAAQDPTHADITIGPARAIWPRDPVSIAVRIVDRPADAEAFKPHVDVTVNGHKVGATFIEHHGEWRATIAPSHAKGPWIMRVTATDPEGHSIGYSFLEIAGQ